MEKYTEKIFGWVCCTKNWTGIANHCKKMESQFHNPIWVATDGSGFDMTQSYEIEMMHYKNMCRIIDSGDVVLPDYIDVKTLKEAIKPREWEKIVMNDEVHYKIHGTRKSGDAFTFYYNTLANYAYIMAVAKDAGIPI